MNRKCEVCGQTKADGEFSKAYPNRCKKCVAQKARESRAAKSVQEDMAGIIIPGTVLDSLPDWEQRRYDLALTIFLNELSTGSAGIVAARHAREAADNFIKEMK